MGLCRNIWNVFVPSWIPATGESVNSLRMTLFLVLCCLGQAIAAPQNPPKIRPYTGIGILLLSSTDAEPLYLYDEPGLSRRGALKPDAIPRYQWIFGTGSHALPLIVSARKGQWLRVAFDDAGREAWLKPVRRNASQPWDIFFKTHFSRLLPGLQKKYYKLCQLPDKNCLSDLSPSGFFKVLRLEDDWAQIVADQNTIGWVRWRDEDGRLLMGITTPLSVIHP